MGTRRNEEREARNAGAPRAWVRGQYLGESQQFEGEPGSAAYEDPMLFEEKGLHPVETALGLAVAVAIIVGLVWLFTPQVPSSLIIGSTSTENDVGSLPAQGVKSSVEAPASQP